VHKRQRPGPAELAPTDVDILRRVTRLRMAVAGLRHPHVETMLAEADRKEVDLVAISDTDQDVRAERAAALGVPGHPDHRALLGLAPDVLAVAAVNCDRAQIIVDALAAGCHVLADKPMCTTLADLDAIDRAARRSSGSLTLLLEKRWYPETQACIAVVEQGELGDVVAIEASGPHRLRPSTRPAWMFDPLRYGGLLNDLAVHDLDLARLFGRYTGTVSAGTITAVVRTSRSDPPGFADHGAALVAFDGGPVMQASVDWLSPESAPYHGDYRMRLTGTRGTADLRWRERRLTVATDDRPPRELALGPPPRAAAAVFDALLAGDPLEPDLDDSIEATRLALLAQHAADTGTPQRF
jgi:predicted dehydrogenase